MLFHFLLIAFFARSSFGHHVDPFARIVYPKVLEARVRRHSDPTHGTAHTVQLADWKLQLAPSALLAPALTAEWADADRRLTAERLQPVGCEFSSGHVYGQVAATKVAMTICNRTQFVGYINIGGTTRSAAIDNPMAPKKPAPDAWLFNLTGDTIDIGIDSTSLPNIGIQIPITSDNSTARVSETWQEEQIDDDDETHFYDTAWTYHSTSGQSRNRSNLSERWIEIALGVDHTLIDFHGKTKVEQYVLSLMNIVNAIYQDSSLDANIHLVVSRLLLYPHKKHSVVHPGDAKKSLENANEWNRKLSAQSGSRRGGGFNHDLALWLTRSDIGGPSGFAPVGGVCDPKRSCALNRDEGLSSAFIIAHEMAHVLGLGHDGDKTHSNECEAESTAGSVMAALVSATFHQFSWSKCSKRELEALISNWTCLDNPPTEKTAIFLNATLQNTFNMDEQCRMEFGAGYESCRAFDIMEPCSHLWCGHNKSPMVCRTKKGSPLEGTQCGLNRWCRSGYCEDMSLRHSSPILLNPQNGGWGAWTPWGACSRSCGMGVQFRTRKCNNPNPMYGGEACGGAGEKWRICNRNRVCPEPWSDLRAQQCKRLPKLLNLAGRSEWNMTWLPFESEQFAKKCKLICISEDTRQLFESGDNLIDGTPCSYESSDNICIQGVCQVLGCDGRLLSNAKTDTCGICGGNNSNCSTAESIVHRKLKQEVTRMAVIPRMATQIELEANTTSLANNEPALAFILKNRKKKRYFITVPHTNESSTEIIEGTKFLYDKHKTRHLIRAKGPVLAETVVLIYAPLSEIEKGVSVKLRVRYVTKTQAKAVPSRFKWIVGGWGPCSASCGGGRRQKTVACWDEGGRKLVRRKHCLLTDKPSPQTEKCNLFDCHFQWYSGAWEPCSATCGLYGVQFRELYCVPRAVLERFANGSVIARPWSLMVSPKKCSGLMPTFQRACNRVQCPSFWAFGQWSTCSTTCGGGYMYRSSYCPAPTNESYFTCGEAAVALQKRDCFGDAKWSHKLCKKAKKECLEDQSDFCAFEYLQKYCQIGTFRKICCKSCRSFSSTV